MKSRDWVFIGLAFASAGAFLAWSAARGAFGFALDDAWIHQVYARNLGTRGEFAFFPGQPSAGSTSPLWTILLSLSYISHFDFQIWAYLLGALLLGAAAIISARLTWRLTANRYPLLTLLVPFLVVFEWHLAWSAVSGMEIPLFVFLSLFLLERFYAHERAWVIGLIAGLLTLTRPEGVVLAALVVAGKVTVPRRGEEHKEESIENLRALGVFAILFGVGFLALVVPYLIFNFAVSGTILPNTFYAKNIEYAILFERTSFLVQWLQLLAVPWIGAQVLLVPGVLYSAFSLVRKREWNALIPFTWLLILPALYAARLPVAYQHGRYEMPIIPFILLYGVWGTAALFERIKIRALRTTWVVSTVVLLITFWVLGANAYATDVAIIDCEMVQTAHWVAQNAPADAVVAAHDIGALEFFYPRPFIDLAGLVTPDVIPFMRDEGRLRDYLFAHQATFAIFFPDWYPALSADPRFVPVHQSNCAVTREAGGTNMVVYQIK